MYGLPKNFDGSFLIGRSLELLCFSANQVNLHFGLDVSISVTSALCYQPLESELLSNVVDGAVIRRRTSRLFLR